MASFKIAQDIRNKRNCNMEKRVPLDTVDNTYLVVKSNVVSVKEL